MPEPTYVFPDLSADDYGVWHHDKDKKILWIGVSVNPKTHDYEGAWAFLLSMKHVLWQYYAQLTREAILRRNLAPK